MASNPGRGAQVRLDGEAQQLARGAGAARLAESLALKAELERLGIFADGTTQDGSTRTGLAAEDEVLTPGGEVPSIEDAALAGAAAGTAAVQTALDGATQLGDVALLLNGDNETSAKPVVFQRTLAATPRTLRDRAREAISVLEFAPSLYDAATDYAAAINAATLYAQQQGRGAVMIPNMGFAMPVGDKLILRRGVQIFSNGAELKMMAGVNKTLLEGENFQAITGTNSSAAVAAAVQDFGIYNLILNGNRAENTSPAAAEGHGLAFYGRDFILRDVVVKNAGRRAVHSEYATTSFGISPFNGRIMGLLIDTCGEEGWYNKVSDAHVEAVNVRSPGQTAHNTYDAIVFAASGGPRMSNVNVWKGGSAANNHRYSMRCQAPVTLFGCHLETGATANLYLASGCQIDALESYSLPGSAVAHIICTANRAKLKGRVADGDGAVALQMGDGAGGSPNSSQIELSVSSVGRGLVEWLASSGNNRVDVQYYLSAALPLQIGQGNTSSTFSDIVSYSGYTNGGSRASKLGGPADGRHEIGLQANANAVGARAQGENVNANGTYSEATGRNTTASGIDSRALGNNSVAYHRGATAQASGSSRAAGGQQRYQAHWFNETADATQTELYLGGSSSNRFFLNQNWCLAGTLSILGVQIGGSAIRISREYKLIVTRQSTTATLVMQTPNEISRTDAALDCVVQLDTATSTYLEVRVTGKSGVTMLWNATFDGLMTRMSST